MWHGEGDYSCIIVESGWSLSSRLLLYYALYLFSCNTLCVFVCVVSCVTVSTVLCCACGVVVSLVVVGVQYIPGRIIYLVISLMVVSRCLCRFGV